MCLQNDKSVEKRLIKSRGHPVLSDGRPCYDFALAPYYARALAYWPNSHFVSATRSEQINPIVYARGHFLPLPRHRRLYPSLNRGSPEVAKTRVRRRCLLRATHKMDGRGGRVGWVAGETGKAKIRCFAANEEKKWRTTFVEKSGN